MPTDGVASEAQLRIAAYRARRWATPLAIWLSVQGDVPVLMGVVVTLVVLVVIVNLVIDVVSGWVNPKVRVQ